MRRRVLTTVLLSFVALTLNAQNPLKDAKRMPDLTIELYAKQLSTFGSSPSKDRADQQHRGIYQYIYGWTPNNPMVVEFTFVHCDIDTFERKIGIYSGVKQDTMKLVDYLDLMFTLYDKNDVLIRDVEYKVLDTISLSDSAVVLRLKKQMKLMYHGQERKIAHYEKGLFRYNADYEEWQIRDLSFDGDAEYEDSQVIYAKDWTTQLPPVDQVVTVAGIEIKLIYVQGGRFKMGCTPGDKYCTRDEKNVKTMDVKDYHISETLVTQQLWNAIMGKEANHSSRKIDLCPVEVTYDEVVRFLNRLNDSTQLVFDLPTEREWEYAARGGANSKGYIFAGSNDINEVCIGGDDSPYMGIPQKVKRKKPNELGLYDMSGNVWEWTKTRFAPLNRYESPMNIGKAEYVTRGGCTASPTKDCRVSTRRKTPKSERANIGFRLVLRSK